MILATIVIIALAYWFTRHVVGRAGISTIGKYQQNESLKLLHQLQLGKDQRLAVVKAGEKYLLLGITAQSISLLTELSEEEASVWIKSKDAQDAAQTAGFRQMLTDAVQKRKQG